MDDLDFKIFLNEKIKEKGVSLQKLSELTNIAVSHLENLSAGKYGELPPAPYLHGYIDKLGFTLGFDPEEWWEVLKRERNIKSSGASDALPKNRYAKVFSIKIAAGIAAAVIVILLVVWRLPQILGVPQITLTDPASAVSIVNAPEFTFAGSVANGNVLTLNSENIPLNPDGSWTKTVSLQPGPNNFNITASKTLGRSVTLVRQIFYEAPLEVAATPTGTATSTAPLDGSQKIGTSAPAAPQTTSVIPFGFPPQNP